MKAALLQLCSSDDPAENLRVVSELMDRAAKQGADIVLTPEVTNCVSLDREHQQSVLRAEDQDPVLAALRDRARDLGIWLSIGSLALTGGDGGRFVNRSVLVSPSGEITARYDKIHMFDVQVSEAETYRESDGYAPGDRAVLAPTPLGCFGLTICYDLRFAHLYRRLAQAGAQVLLVPSAFSPGTGPAHWKPLLRARAIETGCYVIAAAQSGTHAARAGRQRRTHGHSMVISPWGEVLLDAGTETGIYTIDIELEQVADTRRRLPAIHSDRTFRGP
ncbi:carbon-nitrogen hydrolase family protein [Salibaculum sp.]|uniref:carbon-nitrogen hydrolase family protein n=1 Tax=Salibaculum sp. TaxID=2855480 RepID=UPI002B464CBE|nr:carbon-nitrogen hydrolase family protein [Salibaculum sp.]HKL70934.1 carbon-nitrogen hydrolase family protein [Salibaculum sp.]